ncbi:ATP-dependent Clp protease ATP-binding subunit [Candidatus Uhrbacteria bacterium]|nr:ATP-dependent Clp protease ATP-binding subunit [Candidatus Uhrbacteria bacterium]
MTNQPSMENLIHNSTHNLRRILAQAAQLAAFEGKEKIEPTHLFYSLTNQVEHFLTNLSALKKKSKTLKKQSKKIPPSLSPTSKKIILDAAALADHYNHSHIGTEHLFASLLESKNPHIKKIIKEHRLDSSKIKDQLSAILQTSSKIADLLDTILPHEALPPGEGGPHEEPVQAPTKSKRASALEYFAVHLTDSETAAKCDPLIGREKELERLMRVLARRTKNNPVLLGNPGVGKTAIVEGLAKAIVQGNVPDVLKDKKVYSLNLTALIAGSAFRGELEMRFKQVLDEVKNDNRIILFIDEIHNLVGAGSSNGSLDAGNIVKPALARGEMRCIGATTYQEYKKYIEEDPALERRFQPISVPQPSEEEAVQILTGLAPNYEQYHHVKIQPEAIRAAIDMSQRYIPEKFLPDKAIDLIDEASAKLKIENYRSDLALTIARLRKETADIARHKEHALYEKNDLQTAQGLHYQEVQLKKTLTDLLEQEAASVGVITPQRIGEVVSSITGIPVRVLLQNEKERYLKLEDCLSEYIVGQHHAKKTVANFIRRAKSGLLKRGRPIASFAFLGPSGVGKTELARVIAKEMFGTDGLLKLDMSEFSESFNLSRLIGAPSGYIGYREGGKLTEAVRQRPHSLVLFDEIEKAHPRVAQILLQILEDGVLTDAAGKKVDFSNTMIVITSNIGAKKFTQNGSLGFLSDAKESSAKTKEYVMEELKSVLNPELINRLDQIIVFDQLTKEDIAEIVELKLEELRARVAPNNITLSWTPKLKKELIERSYNLLSGARNVRHLIESVIENKIAETLLALESDTPLILSLDYIKNDFVCKVK